MIRVYCDTGAYRRELAEFERSGAINVFGFSYENKNGRIKNIAIPSAPSLSQVNYTWDRLRRDKGARDWTWDGLRTSSEKFPEILKIVGLQNRVDAQHLDSALRSKCSLFLTSDKDDIWSNRERIGEVVGICVLHFVEDWPLFLEAVAEGGGRRDL